MAAAAFEAAYKVAEAHFDAGEFEQCIAATKANLADMSTSHLHRMKNLILLAGAETDWHKAERCRREAEWLWQVTNRAVDDSEDVAKLQLAGVRSGLDQLREWLEEERPATIDERRLQGRADADSEEEEEPEEEEGVEEDLPAVSWGTMDDAMDEEEEADDDDEVLNPAVTTSGVVLWSSDTVEGEGMSVDQLLSSDAMEVEEMSAPSSSPPPSPTITVSRSAAAEELKVDAATEPRLAAPSQAPATESRHQHAERIVPQFVRREEAAVEDQDQEAS